MISSPKSHNAILSSKCHGSFNTAAVQYSHDNNNECTTAQIAWSPLRHANELAWHSGNISGGWQREVLQERLCVSTNKGCVERTLPVVACKDKIGPMVVLGMVLHCEKGGTVIKSNPSYKTCLLNSPSSRVR